jgi:hypothetical protein
MGSPRDTPRQPRMAARQGWSPASLWDGRPAEGSAIGRFCTSKVPQLERVTSAPLLPNTLLRLTHARTQQTDKRPGTTTTIRSQTLKSVHSSHAQGGSKNEKPSRSEGAKNPGGSGQNPGPGEGPKPEGRLSTFRRPSRPNPANFGDDFSLGASPWPTATAWV